MGKIITTVILACILAISGLSSSGFMVYGQIPPRIRINGNFINTGDQPPVVVDGRTLVPARVVFEALGFDVDWCGDNGRATLTGRIYTVEVFIGLVHMRVTDTNGQIRNVRLDVAAEIINGRTMLPLRGIAEATGMTVTWDSENSIADIITTRAQAPPVATAPTPAPAPTQPSSAFTPVLFIPNTLTLLNSAELTAIISTAPTYMQTRSNITLPNRMLTETELANWIAEYWEVGMNANELEIIMLINEYRIANNLNPLKISPELSMAARFHSQEMMNLEYFGHRSPITGLSSDRGDMFGHASVQDHVSGVTENITGTEHPSGAVESFQLSPGHRAAMLQDHHLSIGVGVGGGGTVVKFGA